MVNIKDTIKTLVLTENKPALAIMERKIKTGVLNLISLDEFNQIKKDIKEEQIARQKLLEEADIAIEQFAE